MMEDIICRHGESLHTQQILLWLKLITLVPFQEYHCLCEYLHEHITKSALIICIFSVRCVVDGNTYSQTFASSLVQPQSCNIRTLLDPLWLLLVSSTHMRVVCGTQLTMSELSLALS
jgi:hypothetical protein